VISKPCHFDNRKSYAIFGMQLYPEQPSKKPT